MRSSRHPLRLLFSLLVPGGPRDYLRWGFGLMVAKYLVDATVIWVVARKIWSPIDYLNPSLSLREPTGPLPAWLSVTMVVWALPFLWIGASMTVRRTVDAGRAAWWGLLFFVPVVNYLIMIALCFMASRPTAPGEAPAAEPATETGASDVVPIDRRTRSALLGLGTALVLGVLLTFVSTVVFRSYGWSLFFGAPFVISVITGYIHNRHELRPARETVLVAATGLALVAGALLLFAVEGLVCVAMAFPLAVVIAWMGGLFGREIARQRRARLAHAAWL